MVLASGSFVAGEVVGVAVLVLVVVGVARTFARSDLSWREKVLGKKRPPS